MDIRQVGVVCYGNIARSQVLGIYLNKSLKEIGIGNIKVYSVGTAPYEACPDTPKLIKEVEEKLRKRKIYVKPKRNCWSKRAETELKKSEVILAADKERKSEVISRLKDFPQDSVYTFYEFIGEGNKDIEDTYDYKRGCQDSVKFKGLFRELERIAGKIANRLKNCSLAVRVNKK